MEKQIILQDFPVNLNDNEKESYLLMVYVMLKSKLFTLCKCNFFNEDRTDFMPKQLTDKTHMISYRDFCRLFMKYSVSELQCICAFDESNTEHIVLTTGLYKANYDMDISLMLQLDASREDNEVRILSIYTKLLEKMRNAE